MRHKEIIKLSASIICNEIAGIKGAENIHPKTLASIVYLVYTGRMHRSNQKAP